MDDTYEIIKLDLDEKTIERISKVAKLNELTFDEVVEGILEDSFGFPNFVHNWKLN